MVLGTPMEGASICDDISKDLCGMVKTCSVQLLLINAPAFSPEHSGHERQSLNEHFLVNGDLSRAHQALHAAISVWRTLDVVVFKHFQHFIQIMAHILRLV